MAQHAQERLLNGILGVGGIAQNGEGHTIERRGILADQRREGLLIRCLAKTVHERAIWNFHPT